MVEGVDYIVYVHRSTEIETFKQFFGDFNTIVPGYSFKNDAEFKKNLNDLLRFKVGSTTNFKNVMKAYPLEIRDSSYYNSLLSNDFSVVDKIYPGTVLFLPLSKVGYVQASITLTKAQSDHYNYKTFFPEYLKKLQQDPLYTPTIKFGGKNLIISQVSHVVSVWLIKKANPFDLQNKITPKIIDITESVMNVTTNVSANGGNFTITISPSFLEGGKLVTQTTVKDIVKDRDSEIYRSISENDVIFIRYESLDIERNRDMVGGVLSEADIPDKIYDMIGLVDTVQEFYSPIAVDVMIQGRDLVKVLIDDENYFFPMLFASGQDSSFNTQLKSEKIIKRVFTTGKIENTFIYSMRSVEKTLLFIYSQLANLGVLPEGYEPFSSYFDEKGNDRRGYIVDVTEDKVVKNELANGVWQIMELLIDESVRDRYLADPSISKPDGSILNQIKKICQEPFVEFLTDTYGDKFYLIARKPPFDYQSIKEYIDTPGMIIDIEPEDIYDYTFVFDNQAYTWYQINVNGAFIGGSKMALTYLPIVYFPELANIYGSRKYDIQHNYISYKSFFGHNGAESYGNVKREVINDLIYVIGSTIYLPFTRKGTITLTGDRRVKRGNFIRCKLTGEIFYVDQVSNSIAISDVNVDRSTTLQVSRGMVEQHLSMYFGIVDLKNVKKELERQTITPSQGSNPDFGTTITKSGIRERVLNFFLNRKQFNG